MKLIKLFLALCVTTAMTFFVSQLLLLVGNFNFGLFSQWSIILGKLLQLPLSEIDFVILIFKLDHIFIAIGVACIIWKFYDIFASTSRI